ncbi:MAG: hypothetical protein U5J96_00365, partial [Ignavibacteriaceae bacterium]|nr:hypothetical protein [Ignavibacteriaceae bacterium]
LIALAFNFIHSEIIDQLEGNSKCEAQDYCTLVQTISVKTAASDKAVTENIILIDFICPNCLKQVENSKLFYEKHQNFSFHHLKLESKHIFNKSFLI